jgi:hypothetical protein
MRSKYCGSFDGAACKEYLVENADGKLRLGVEKELGSSAWCFVVDNWYTSLDVSKFVGDFCEFEIGDCWWYSRSLSWRKKLMGGREGKTEGKMSLKWWMAWKKLKICGGSSSSLSDGMVGKDVEKMQRGLNSFLNRWVFMLEFPANLPAISSKFLRTDKPTKHAYDKKPASKLTEKAHLQQPLFFQPSSICYSKMFQ